MLFGKWQHNYSQKNRKVSIFFFFIFEKITEGFGITQTIMKYVSCSKNYEGLAVYPQLYVIKKYIMVVEI